MDRQFMVRLRLGVQQLERKFVVSQFLVVEFVVSQLLVCQ